ncbi:MAG: Slp family lipoprotein [Lysobacteraceae bacterium]
MNRTLCLLIATAALTGCVTVPKPLQGQFATIAPETASTQAREGDLVRWGGRIVEVQPSAEQTCFEIVSRPLSDSARPVANADISAGRFLACRAGFYDPAIFTAQRDLTVTGRIIGFETRRIGEYDYRYPKLAAEVIYLWPQVNRTQVQYIHDPFWPGYGYWGPRPILIHRTPAPPPPASGG